MTSNAISQNTYNLWNEIKYVVKYNLTQFDSYASLFNLEYRHEQKGYIMVCK